MRRRGKVKKDLHTWESCKKPAAAVLVADKSTVPAEEDAETEDGADSEAVEWTERSKLKK